EGIMDTSPDQFEYMRSGSRRTSFDNGRTAPSGAKAGLGSQHHDSSLATRHAPARLNFFRASPNHVSGYVCLVAYGWPSIFLTRIFAFEFVYRFDKILEES